MMMLMMITEMVLVAPTYFSMLHKKIRSGHHMTIFSTCDNVSHLLSSNLSFSYPASAAVPLSHSRLKTHFMLHKASSTLHKLLDTFKARLKTHLFDIV